MCAQAKQKMLDRLVKLGGKIREDYEQLAIDQENAPSEEEIQHKVCCDADSKGLRFYLR